LYGRREYCEVTSRHYFLDNDDLTPVSYCGYCATRTDIMYYLLSFCKRISEDKYNRYEVLK
jgi:hypothetical protein